MMRLGTLVPCADQYVTLRGREILVSAIVAGGRVPMDSSVAELQALCAEGYVCTGTQRPISLVITDKGRKIMEGAE
jgi:hypothetical protein